MTGTDGGPLCPGQLQEDPVGGHAAAAGPRGAARQGDRHQEDAQRRRGQKVGVRALADLHSLHLKLGYLSTKRVGTFSIYCLFISLDVKIEEPYLQYWGPVAQCGGGQQLTLL